MVNILKIFKKTPKVLVIVGGNKEKITPFFEAGKALNIDTTIASFSELSYTSYEGEFVLKVGEHHVREFTHIYIRMVGKRLEDVTVLCNYAKTYDIKLVDSLYENSLLMPSSLGKSIEMMKLISSNVSMPKTIFGSVSDLSKIAVKELGFPLVFKSTTGKKAREVWSPEKKKDLKPLIKKLEEMEKNGMRFFAQEFVKSSERIRVFVIGGKAVAAIVRPARWRKRFGSAEGRKCVLNPIPVEESRLSVIASKACQLDVAGVDIVKDDKTGKLYVLEVNAAPVWKALSHDTGVNIEQEILKFVISK